MDETNVLRFLQDELNEEERKSFFEWLESDPRNKDLFISIKQSWVLTAGSKAKGDLNPSLEYKSFYYRNFYSIPDNTKVSRALYMSLYKIAGLFIVAFGLSFLCYYLILRQPVTHNAGFTVINTRAGEKSQITMPDGSKIWVNACTRLKYPNDFGQNNLDLYLDGEAYFDIKKIPNRKITVHTSQINIKVLGTAFNVKSYPDDNIIETTLVRGEIALEKQSSTSASGKEIYLKPNQSATFFKNTKKLAMNQLVETKIEAADNSDEVKMIAGQNNSNLVVINKMNPETQVSWKDGKLTFKRESFENLTKVMERWFNKAIELKDPSLQNVRFSGTFDKETVEQALDALSMPVPFKYVIQKDSVFIYKK